MHKIEVYQPKYYKKFQCTGSQCRDNCCHTWGIGLDKVTYDKYMSLDEETRTEFVEKISVLNEEPLNARMKLDEDGNCGFLDKRGMCTIHKRFGHEYLSYTCRTYPRKLNYVAGDAEAFLGLSCEVVARLILLEQDIMRFEKATLEVDDQRVFENTLKAEKYTQAPNANDIFWKLRTASIVTVQSRRHRLWVRMLILGMFIKQASELLSEGKYDEIIEYAGKQPERLEKGFYDSLNEQLPGKDDLRIEFLNGLLSSMDRKQNKIFSGILARSRGALGISPDGDIPENFSEDFQRYYETYFGDNEYIIENYVVSHIFSGGFPFNYKYEDSIMKNYKELLVKYNLVKLMLVGISRHQMKFDKRRVVECVSSFSRAYDHHLGGALLMK